MKSNNLRNSEGKASLLGNHVGERSSQRPNAGKISPTKSNNVNPNELLWQLPPCAYNKDQNKGITIRMQSTPIEKLIDTGEYKFLFCCIGIVLMVWVALILYCHFILIIYVACNVLAIILHLIIELGLHPQVHANNIFRLF